MNVLPIIDHLKGLLVPDIVGAVTEADNLQDVANNLKGGKPWAFVMFDREQAGAERGFTGMTSQRVIYRFSVAIAQAGAGMSGKSRSSDLEDRKDVVVRKLVGRQLEGMVTPITFVGSAVKMKDFEKALVIIGADFATEYQLREPNNA